MAHLPCPWQTSTTPYHHTVAPPATTHSLTVFSSLLLPLFKFLLMYIMSNPSGKNTAVPTSKRRKGAASSSSPTAKIRHPFLQFPLGPQEELFQILRARPLGLFFEIIELTCIELTLELCSTFHLQVVMTQFDDPGMVQFCLGGRRESTRVVNTHEAYFLWSMANGHVFDLAYFIALAISHQTEWHRKGVISIGPYVTHLAQYFGLLNMASQASSLTLIGQMSPQGISKFQISSSLRNLKIHWKRFSMTVMSCPTTTITFLLGTVVVEPNLYHHRSILL
ncbi:hypothetical protein GOBAR_AA21289 [Gossypium barbadense]|uniref:Uncharacterized protein n=1 Tax=Gossypium barbadense TaxID=3634 RepID=A0A2P5X7R1_GOSBA|nr:hypothetical protein GOBAR_AA21289 [Gossypium barbadense]